MKKPLTKNKWFWIAMVIIVLAALGNIFGLYDKKAPVNDTTKATTVTNNSMNDKQSNESKEPPYIIAGSVPTYKIIDEGEVNYSTVIRPVCNIVAESGLSQSDIENIAKDIVNRYIKLKKVNAVGIFIFSDKSKIGKEAYDIAKIDWAPYGDWGKAGDIESGDYTKHKFNITLSQQ